ncbi:MAG: hypothetical protein M3T56_18340 [Chloroflexota bacterium]|nr:hypothetical protein [Chloroflexota bacterium]
MADCAAPFDCIAAHEMGSQYATGESPAAVLWLITSLIFAPLAVVAGIGLTQRGLLVLGRIVAATGILPNLVLFAGTYAVPPFHATVFALTLVAVGRLLFICRHAD